eukprot:5939146-Pyramimonas_sp.AAC.1
MRPSVGQNKENIQRYPPQDAEEHPTNTKNTGVPPRTDLDHIPGSDCTRKDVLTVNCRPSAPYGVLATAPLLGLARGAAGGRKGFR